MQRIAQRRKFMALRAKILSSFAIFYYFSESMVKKRMSHLYCWMFWRYDEHAMISMLESLRMYLIQKNLSEKMEWHYKFIWRNRKQWNFSKGPNPQSIRWSHYYYLILTLLMGFVLNYQVRDRGYLHAWWPWCSARSNYVRSTKIWLFAVGKFYRYVYISPVRLH